MASNSTDVLEYNHYCAVPNHFSNSKNTSNHLAFQDGPLAGDPENYDDFGRPIVSFISHLEEISTEQNVYAVYDSTRCILYTLTDLGTINELTFDEQTLSQWNSSLCMGVIRDGGLLRNNNSFLKPLKKGHRTKSRDKSSSTSRSKHRSSSNSSRSKDKSSSSSSRSKDKSSSSNSHSKDNKISSSSSHSKEKSSLNSSRSKDKNSSNSSRSKHKSSSSSSHSKDKSSDHRLSINKILSHQYSNSDSEHRASGSVEEKSNSSPENKLAVSTAMRKTSINGFQIPTPLKKLASKNNVNPSPLKKLLAPKNNVNFSYVDGGSGAPDNWSSDEET